MAYDYIGICNKVLRHFNEVTFADAAEFNAAVGFQQDIKDAVNDVIADIYAREDNTWPFQWTQTTQVLTIGDETYTTPSDTADVDWESFYIDKVFADESDLTSITADSGTKTFTAAAGSFITAGFAVGMKVQWSNLSANTGTDFTINTLTATVMTVDEAVTTITTPDTDFEVTNAFSTPDARKLGRVNIDTYRNNYLEQTKNAKLSDTFTKPAFMVRQSDNSYILGPIKPDATYLVRYDYYQGFTVLSASTDVPKIPERYERVILAGGKKIGNEFRDNVELAASFENQFEKGINEMRRDLIPQPVTARFEA